MRSMRARRAGSMVLMDWAVAEGTMRIRAETARWNAILDMGWTSLLNL
jgi:hypothetical protein